MRNFNKLLGMFSGVKRSGDIPQVTDYLVNNPKFRSTVGSIENAKKGFWFNIEKYLDRELLGKEDPKEIDSLDSQTKKANK